MSEKLTRENVISIASQILINLGLINTAALAASLADLKAFESVPYQPFAVGLIAALAAQLLWYFDTELEFMYERKVFSTIREEKIANIIITFTIVGSAVLSASCIVFGCFKLLEFSDSDSRLFSALICALPFLSYIYILFRKESQ